MTLEYITVQDAKEICRVTHDHDDWLFELLIAAATEAVLTFADDWTPTEDEDEVPARIKLAILMHVTRVYREHDDGSDVPDTAKSLVWPLRRVSI